ncbi:MAG: hypothetical protein PHO37_11755 [Kiritimatiellae bacterium]|nr:hypothetical protein [Kiritimatiellia bacterium]
MNLCKLHQWLWSCASEEGRELPALTEQHLRRCSRCREIVGAMQQVNAKLGVDPVEIDEHWHAGVMGEIRGITRPAPRPAVWPLPVSLAAVAAACVAAFFLRQEPSLEHGEAQTTTLQVASSLASAAGEVAGSLEHEGAALQQDLQQALQIATSCLPF